MPKGNRLLGLLIVIALLAGCGHERVLEQLALVGTVGYDLEPTEEEGAEEQVRVTALFPVFSQQKLVEVNISAAAPMTRGVRNQLSRETDLMLANGQVRHILFGKSLAAQGIWRQLKAMERSVEISERAIVAVVEGTAQDLMIRKYPNNINITRYLMRLLRKDEDISMDPEITLHEFVRDLLDDGIDPVAPVVRATDQTILLEGVALFDDDRYVAKVPPNEVFYLSLLRGKLEQADWQADLSAVGSPGDRAVFASVSGKKKIKAVTADAKANRFKVELSFDLYGSLLEYEGKLNLETKEGVRELEAALSRLVVRKTENLLKTLQQTGSDAAGLGTIIRNRLSYKEWTALDWNAIYPQVDVSCRATFKIRDFGLFL